MTTSPTEPGADPAADPNESPEPRVPAEEPTPAGAPVPGEPGDGAWASDDEEKDEDPETAP